VIHLCLDIGRSLNFRNGQKLPRRYLMLFSTFPFSWGAPTLQATGVIRKGLKKSRKAELNRIREPTRSVTAVIMLSTKTVSGVPPKKVNASSSAWCNASCRWLWVKET
jgi:hypothetical protein